MSNTIRPKQIVELLRGETSIANDAAHRKRIHGGMPPDGHDAPAVRHHDVLALPDYPKPSLFECPDGPKVKDARYLRYLLCRDFHFLQVLLTGKLLGDFEVFPNRVPDVGQSFLFGGTLRPAPREAGAGNAVAFFGCYQSHWVLHTSHCSITVGGPRTTSEDPGILISNPAIAADKVEQGARGRRHCSDELSGFGKGGE